MMTATNRGAVFRLPLHINYEDTDAAGVVYYGNYPGYMERARNACLRENGFSLTRLRRQYGLLFVVTEIHLRYRAPAWLDDELAVTMQAVRRRRASLRCRQVVTRAAADDEVLVDGEVTLALIAADTFTPRRAPTELWRALSPYAAD